MEFMFNEYTNGSLGVFPQLLGKKKRTISKHTKPHLTNKSIKSFINISIQKFMLTFVYVAV